MGSEMCIRDRGSDVSPTATRVLLPLTDALRMGLAGTVFETNRTKFRDPLDAY